MNGATKYTVSGKTMVLDGFNSLLWTDSSPAAVELRTELRSDAEILAKTLLRSVEIHSEDGVCLDAVSFE